MLFLGEAMGEDAVEKIGRFLEVGEVECWVVGSGG